MATANHHPASSEDGTLTPHDVVTSIDRARAAQIHDPRKELRFYVWDAGDDGYVVAMLGPGGGFCDKRVLERRRVENKISDAIDHDGTVELDDKAALLPSRFCGGGR